MMSKNMHALDLTPEVQTGLAWYYLIVTLLNVGAAAHWTFWSRGQKMLWFESAMTAGCGILYAILTVAWLAGLPTLVLYMIGAIANALALAVVLPAALYQKVWAGVAWGLCAVLLQG